MKTIIIFGIFTCILVWLFELAKPLLRKKFPSMFPEYDNWTDYTGDYEKGFYDVELRDGSIQEYCYPNANVWHNLNTGEQYKNDDIIRVRKYTEEEAINYRLSKRDDKIQERFIKITNG